MLGSRFNGRTVVNGSEARVFRLGRGALTPAAP
jgi:hypothetical protein